MSKYYYDVETFYFFLFFVYFKTQCTSAPRNDDNDDCQTVWGAVRLEFYHRNCKKINANFSSTSQNSILVNTYSPEM